MDDYRVDWNTLKKDNNYMPEWITVWQNDIPKWYKFSHNKKGSFIVVNNKRDYLFVNN